MHTITSIQQNSIVIDTPLTAERMGGFKDIEGYIHCFVIFPLNSCPPKFFNHKGAKSLRKLTPTCAGTD